MPRVMEVDNVKVMVLKVIGHELFAVHAEGKVPTTGWTNPALDAFIYIVPPADGIMDFDFVAKAPTGIVGDVVLPIYADTVLPMPKWLKGVRVHAKENSKEAKVGAEIPHLKIGA
jgi:hypothetical protein